MAASAPPPASGGRTAGARARARAASSVAGAPYVALLCAVGVVVSTFLPWYATNLGPPFSPDSVSGFDATIIARAALGLAAVAALAAGALALEGQRALDLGPGAREVLSWVVVAAAAAAAALVAYRLLVLPEPAEFLSRRIGVYLAMAAAVGATLAGLARLRALE